MTGRVSTSSVSLANSLVYATVVLAIQNNSHYYNYIDFSYIDFSISYTCTLGDCHESYIGVICTS